MTTKPWLERRKLDEPIRMLDRAIENWEYLDAEEKFGTLDEVRHELQELHNGE